MHCYPVPLLDSPVVVREDQDVVPPSVDVPVAVIHLDVVYDLHKSCLAAEATSCDLLEVQVQRCLWAYCTAQAGLADRAWRAWVTP